MLLFVMSFAVDLAQGLGLVAAVVGVVGAVVFGGGCVVVLEVDGVLGRGQSCLLRWALGLERGGKRKKE